MSDPVVDGNDYKSDLDSDTVSHVWLHIFGSALEYENLQGSLSTSLFTLDRLQRAQN